MKSKFRLTKDSARSQMKLLVSVTLCFLYLVSFADLGNLVDTTSYNTTLWSEKSLSQEGFLTNVSLSEVIMRSRVFSCSCVANWMWLTNPKLSRNSTRSSVSFLLESLTLMLKFLMSSVFPLALMFFSM